MINRQIPLVDDRIAQLERDLADARREKDQLVNDRDMYQGVIDEAAAEVNRLTKVINGLESRIPGL